MDDDQALKTAAEIIAAMTDPMDSAYQGEDGLLWQEWVVPSGLCYDLMADFAEGDQTDPGKRAQLVTAARAMIDVATRARVAALEAVAEAAQAALDVDPTSRAGAEAHIRLEAALDAAPAAETTSGEQDLQFHCTHSTHEVAPLRCGGKHYGLPCGPGCAPVVP